MGRMGLEISRGLGEFLRYTSFALTVLRLDFGMMWCGNHLQLSSDAHKY
jgi:hypothetical protein